MFVFVWLFWMLFVFPPKIQNCLLNRFKLNIKSLSFSCLAVICGLCKRKSNRNQLKMDFIEKLFIAFIKSKLIKSEKLFFTWIYSSFQKAWIAFLIIIWTFDMGEENTRQKLLVNDDDSVFGVFFVCFHTFTVAVNVFIFTLKLCCAFICYIFSRYFELLCCEGEIKGEKAKHVLCVSFQI